jgi:hypothetical protein
LFDNDIYGVGSVVEHQRRIAVAYDLYSLDLSASVLPQCGPEALLNLSFSWPHCRFLASKVEHLSAHDTQRLRRNISDGLLQTMLTVHSRNHLVQIIFLVAPTPPRHGSVSSAFVLPNNLLHTTPQIILKNRDLVQIDSLHTGNDPVLRVTTLRIYW